MPTDPANIWSIWYSGAPSQPLTKLRPQADEGVSDLQIELVATGDSTRTADGDIRTTTLGMYHRIRVVYELFSSRQTMRQIRTLETHLKRGGLVSFAADTVNAWAIFSRYALAPTTTRVVPIANSPFPSGYTNAAGVSLAGPADDDEVVITSGWPQSAIEHNTINAALYDANGVLQYFDLNEGLVYDHSVSPIVVRYYSFFPICRLAPEARDQPVLVTDHDLTFTFDLVLEEVPAVFWNFEQRPPGVVIGPREPQSPWDDHVILTPRDQSLQRLLEWVRG